jgi:hypothetical protein
MPVADVLAAARTSAARQGFSAGDRVLSSTPWDTPDELIDGLLAVYSAGASLIQVVHPDPAKHDRRVDTERVTVTRA